MRSLRVHRPGMLVAVAAAGVLPGAFLETFGSHPATLAPALHLLLVAIGAGTAGVAAAGVSLAAVRANDGRGVVLATAFTTMTALLAVHGLATPGVLMGDNGVVALAGGISLPVGALLIALAALPAVNRPEAAASLWKAQLAAFCLVLALGATGLLAPQLVPPVPAAGTGPAVVLAIAGGALYALLALRALWTFALTRRPMDLVVVLGCVWLAVALVPQLLIGYGTVAFYGGHLLELVGIGMIALPAVLDLVRGGPSRPLVGDLSPHELVLAEEAYLGPQVRALLVALADKDESTEQHTRRVAELAVRVGEALRLPAPTLRELAVGALLHDVGKLRVPDAVLKKPAGLSDAEFAEIKRHPAAGLRLLQTLGGFSPLVHALVHEHHERLDGSGYPQGLAGDELGLPTRILAVCDVYDALTSDRVYRGAWRRDAALDLLRADAGTTFDARCVQALEDVLAVRPAEPPATTRRRAAPVVAPSS